MRQKGQSLPEYSFVIGLVAVATITGIAMLSNNIQQNMTGSVEQKSKSIPQSQSTVSENLSAPPNKITNEQGGTGYNGSSPLPAQNLCVSGICAHFPIVTQQNDMVDVGAGEGAERIHQFSKTLQELAVSIEADPNHDPQLAAMIRDLAMKGHDLGDNQKAAVDVRDVTHLGERGGKDFSEADKAKNVVKTYHHYENSKNTFDESWVTLQTYLVQNDQTVPAGLSDILSLQKSQMDLLADGIDFSTSMSGTNIQAQNVSLIHQSANTICGQQDQSTCLREVIVN